MIKSLKYKYTLEEDYSYKFYIVKGLQRQWKPFTCEWGSIEINSPSPGGYFVTITVKKGYAWDGCSPKWVFDNGKILGTPEGRIDEKTGKHITYYASLIHDFLYQFKKEHGISRLQADDLFLEMLDIVNFKLSEIYYVVVRLAGWWYGSWY